MLPMFLAAPYLRAQRLISVLDEFSVQSTNIYAILPHHKYVPRKVRCFIDFVKGIFEPTAPWNR
jgi:DNA-binding transcriptional LysR family regulator